MPSPWVWVPQAHVYRNTATGRFLGTTEMLGLRDAYADAKRQGAGELARRLSQGEMNVGQWQKAMQNDVRNSFIDQYVLAHGGRGTMTQADWGRVGRMLKDQYGYLRKFAEEVKAGTLTEKQIAARATMYHNASVQAFEKAHARAMGAPDLPQYPGDGQTECQTNCRCHWDIRPQGDGTFNCFWIIDPGAEHCDDCLGLAEQYNPYVAGK